MHQIHWWLTVLIFIYITVYKSRDYSKIFYVFKITKIPPLRDKDCDHSFCPKRKQGERWRKETWEWSQRDGRHHRVWPLVSNEQPFRSLVKLLTDVLPAVWIFVDTGERVVFLTGTGIGSLGYGEMVVEWRHLVKA